jgi:hypothetical protein
MIQLIIRDQIMDSTKQFQTTTENGSISVVGNIGDSFLCTN